MKQRWLGLAAAFAAACGGSNGGGGDVDAGVVDAAPADAAVPTAWTVTMVAPPAGDAALLPLSLDDATGDVVGYAGPGPWEPASRPVRVRSAGGGPTVEVLEVPEANYGFAWGAGASLSVGEHAWRPMMWTGGARTPLPVPDGWFSGSARAAVDASLIVGSYADYDDALPPNPVGPRPCAWVDGQVRPLALLEPAHANGTAWAVSPAGVIAGALASPQGTVAVRWASAGASPEVLPIADSTIAEARAINAAGDVAGRATLTSGVTHGFVARAGAAPVLLPHLPGGRHAEAFDVSPAGIVVGTAGAGGEAHAVAWIDGAIVDLNDRVSLPAGVRYLSSAVGITDEGVIAAEAVMDAGPGDGVRQLAILRPE